jgi:hypothetical protein
MSYSYQIKNLKIFIVKVYIKQFLLFLNLEEIFLKIIKVFKCLSEKHLKVINITIII